MIFTLKKTWAALAVCGAALLAGSPAVAAPPPELTALTEQLPPLNMELEGRVTGFASELLDLVAAEAGVPLRKLVLPWARAYGQALRQPDTLVYSMVRTPEREALFRWIGPISPRRVLLYRWADRPDIVIKSLEDARPYRIGSTLESAATKMLEKSGFTAVSVNEPSGGGLELGVNDETNMRKFLAKRFDLLVALDWAAAYHAKSLGMDPALLVPVWVLDESSAYWYGVNPGTDPDTIKRLDQALAKVKADGRYQQLRQRYLMKAAK
ncbi:transporter substrate-binding domain-containing protein [Rhodoferax sp.]|uniref:substrate-binding periplasmic protein n=1 Tax=Rhodoferax sp. TaxID=50421 RepID=UPI0025F3128E|nr:transporter substrate-binding domain-containing protein [Rhodoferax sp.]